MFGFQQPNNAKASAIPDSMAVLWLRVSNFNTQRCDERYDAMGFLRRRFKPLGTLQQLQFVTLTVSSCAAVEFPNACAEMS